MKGGEAVFGLRPCRRGGVCVPVCVHLGCLSLALEIRSILPGAYICLGETIQTPFPPAE